jgi:PhoPQ-activated pathogenicity-related protein
MFVDDTSKPEVLLRLPMTKGAVRTMDTTEQFLVELGHQKPVRWGVTGASKRGWAAWTVAAVDYERTGDNLTQKA